MDNERTMKTWEGKSFEESKDNTEQFSSGAEGKYNKQRGFIKGA